MNKFYKMLLNRRGYTIDQTILIVAIIAILITLIIITIGWNLINRTSGTKLGSQLKQFEGAITQFYGANKVFPHQAFSTAPTTPAAGYVVALTGLTPTGAAFSTNVTTLTNLLPGFAATAASLANSNGGTITMMNNTVNAWTGSSASIQYYVVQFSNIPFADAQEADKSIDGSIDGAAGRLVWDDAACLNTTAAGAAAAITVPTSGNVYVCYVASPIN